MTDISDFFKLTNDIKNERIEEVFESIAESNLIYLPQGAISAEQFYALNVDHRKQIGNSNHLYNVELSSPRPPINLQRKLSR